jgi:transcriptional antiterminator NusG
VNNDVDNTTDPFAAQAADPPVPSHVPPEAEATVSQEAVSQEAVSQEEVSHQAAPGESVDTERQSGSVDLTGTTDTPEEQLPPSQPPAEPPAAQAPAPRAKEAKKTKTATQVAVTDEADEGEINRQWYILKVQTNREESIRDALQRRVAMAGLEKFFGEIIVPTEMVSEFKGGKKRVSKRKLYPGYIVVNMEINDDTWYLVRETSGIGDFTGAMGRPTPMAPQDVAKIVAKTEEKTDEAPRVDIRFKPADRVRIKEGTFENFEGNVEAIDQANGRVTVMINIFGRSTPVELEYWQIEAV